MLLSQGWAPGATLGAPNAAYKQHLTQASQSHIRVAMRADNLGLGAKTGSGQEAGECVGLDAFQAMLGRLNGKSEEVLGKEQEVRNDMKLRAHVERKGMVRFVYGGRLVGDDHENEEQGEAQTTATASEAEKPKTKEKRKQKAKSQVAEQNSSAADATGPADGSRAERKKSKKRKKAAEGDVETTGTTSPTDIASVEASPDAESGSEDEKTRKARRKAEKAEKRERKRLRREAKEAERADSSADQDDAITTIPAAPQHAQKEVLTVQLPSSGTASPAAVSGRHMSVRSRYIAAKRRAVMDPQALKEVCQVSYVTKMSANSVQILMVKA